MLFRSLHTAQKDLTKYLGLVGYWSFNYNVGDKVLDLSGNENHGILKPSYPGNCSLFKDSLNKKFGKCLSFDGVDDYVDCGSLPSLYQTPNNQWTIMAWVKPRELTGSRNIVRKNGGGNGYYL